jgi:hypothetical protein
MNELPGNYLKTRSAWRVARKIFNLKVSSLRATRHSPRISIWSEQHERKADPSIKIQRLSRQDGPRAIGAGTAPATDR